MELAIYGCLVVTAFLSGLLAGWQRFGVPDPSRPREATGHPFRSFWSALCWQPRESTFAITATISFAVTLSIIPFHRELLSLICELSGRLFVAFVWIVMGYMIGLRAESKI